MAQTTVSSAPRRTAGQATAAVLLGAGLACAGNAHAGTEALASETTETAEAIESAGVAIPTAIDMAVAPVAMELPALVETQPAVAVAPAAPVVPAVAAVAELPPVAAVAVSKPAPVERVAVKTVAEAPARVVPVDKASVVQHRPSEDLLAVAMNMAVSVPDAPVAAARKDMAKWKPVAQARLEESRGGFDAGGLQIGFGIDRAVFVNGALAVSTSITIPDISSITAAQATQLAQALGQVTVAVGAANNAANAAVASAQAAAAAAQGAAGAAGQSATASANGAAGTAQGAAGAASSSASAGAAGAAGMAAGAAGMARQAVANAAGTVVTNGLLTVIQNGAGNVANVGAISNMPGTVIQNNLNNQNIQSLMTLNASVNTLAAFRSQMANTALNSVLQRSAAMR